MPFIGNKPSAVPLTSADIADSIITSAKITDATIVNGDIANATIALAKLSATGTASASTFLRGDNSWGSAGASAGQVIQVVTATDQTSRTTTSTSFVTASNTLSVSITPSSASNKILIVAGFCFGGDWLGSYGSDNFVTLYRDATNLGNGSNGMAYCNSPRTACHLSYLDSPSSTSSVTYQVYIKSDGNGTGLNTSNSKGSITALEVKG